MTWYNIFLHYNEDRTCFHKLLSPFVLLFYPIWIVPVTLGLCLYGGVRCISWYWDSWIAEVCNPDSGFCAWICEQFNLPDCSPYQVVLLSAESENSKAPSPQNVWRIKKSRISKKKSRSNYWYYYYFSSVLSCYLLMDLVRQQKKNCHKHAIVVLVTRQLFYQNWASRWDKTWFALT